ncbi:MAG: UDP-2,3-diacylglucosamine diphosphatase LpxI [Nitrospiraceae bacterium]|nr:MAG: UDP-2,3-diacylglucosamine diphosphatase LpxI [Nitrospiraceae bacterium]
MPLKAYPLSNGSKTLGIIAGMGRLPLAIASEAKKMGYRVVGISLQPPGDTSLKPHVDSFHISKVSKLGSLISLMQKNDVRDAVMAGKVPKSILYQNKLSLIPDMKMAKLLFSIKDRADDTILKAIVSEIEKNGITIHETTAFTGDLMAPEGVMTRNRPTKEEMQDIGFGWNIAKKMGELDIGQTVVVKDLAVMAIEAIEGTDEAVVRGGRLAVKGAVVVKVSKPQQDMRFDVPVVGTNTLHSMIKTSARVLAIEAEKCIIVDRDAFIQEADSNGIAIIGIDSESADHITV